MSELMNHINTLFDTNVVLGVFVTTLGLALAYYMVYFILHVIVLFVMSINAGAKMLAGIYESKTAASSAAHGVLRNDSGLGFTMPDGGESVSKGKKEKRPDQS